MKLLENFEYRKAAVMSILAMCVCGLAAGLQASTITSVTFSVGPANPTIQINGVGFDPQPSVDQLAFAGFIGNDYGSQLHLHDFTNNPAAFDAGFDGPAGFDTIGLIISSYTDHQITYQLGTDYASFYFPSHIFELNEGDAFTAYVHDASFSGNVTYGSAVPEPTSVSLVAIAFIGLFVIQKSRKRNDI